MSKKIAVIGIHTDIGKTIASAVITEALKADYWKPVQAGGLDNSDSMIIQELISNTKTRVHPEAVRLKMAASPHQSAAAEALSYDSFDFEIPKTDNTLIIETAGGVFSPMDADHTMIDFITHFKLPVILIIKHYLGSINHSMLCLDSLKNRKIKPLALIINGPRHPSSEEFILHYFPELVSSFLYIEQMGVLDKQHIERQAGLFKEQWDDKIKTL